VLLINVKDNTVVPDHENDVALRNNATGTIIKSPPLPSPAQEPQTGADPDFPPDSTPNATTKTTVPEQLPKQHPQSNYPNNTPRATTQSTPPLTCTPTTTPPQWMTTSTVRITSCPATGVQNSDVKDEDVWSVDDNDGEYLDIENALPGCVFELPSSLLKTASTRGGLTVNFDIINIRQV
jgi:hypothetical protein